MKILYLTNIPSPYRVDFFNELGKRCELTVIFESTASTERDINWRAESAKNYRAIYLKGIKIGTAESFCPQITRYLTSEYQIIVIGMYSSPTSMYAIEYMKVRKIPFFLNSDGGMVKNDSLLKAKIKRHFISAASAWLSTGDFTTNYLCYYGAKKDWIFKYPFTSMSEYDISQAHLYKKKGKSFFRKKLGMKEKQIILTVGRFTYKNGYGKGYDTLLRAAEQMPKSIGIYIVGGDPTEEFVEWKKNKNLSNIHYVGFKKKEMLAEYYAAADIFTLLSVNDVWGLVINEAMAYSLPIIVSNGCGAGIELIQNGVNGYVISVGDDKDFTKKSYYILKNTTLATFMGKNNYKSIENYTIEKMAMAHISCFDKFISYKSR